MDRIGVMGRRASALAVLVVALVTSVGLTSCDDPAPPLDLSGTGGLEGLVFFDASEDGLFDPADGDFALSGVGIAIQERGTGETLAGGNTSSGADGRFALAGLPLGTHDMLIDELTVSSEISICQNPIRVTIGGTETTFTDVAGRPGCLITILEAKELDAGSFVIVKGIVTSSPGQIESAWTYIQDATAGTKIFSSGLEGQGIQVGDQIEVGGDTELFSGDFDLTGAVSLRNLIPGVGELDPLVVTTEAISASGADVTDPIQGGFIRVEKAQLVAEFGAGGSNLQNGTIDDGSGATLIRIDDGVADRNSLNSILSVGTCYNINGFGANFFGGGQIFPRSLADIVEVPCS